MPEVRSASSRPLVALSLSFLIATACIGRVGDGDTDDPGTGPGNTGGKTGSGGGGLGNTVAPPPGDPDDPITGPIASAPGPSSRLVRLNHKQWANTVADLFRLPAPAAEAGSFLTEPVRSSFDNNGSVLEVSPELWLDYQRGAEAVATKVARDANLLRGLVPTGAPGDMAGKARAFIQSFGLRAYRRPLADAEIARYVALFNQGPALLGGTDPFADGVELVLTYLLQSPHFLYRTELSTAVTNGMVRLNDYEVASRLSYGLANSMPDDMLFAAASAKKLRTRDEVMAHAQRLLNSPKGQATLRDFHEQLYATHEFAEVKRDPMRQPLFTPGLGDDMRHEAELFVDDVVFAREKGLTEMLTASYTFANSKLAAIYGVPGTAPAMGQTDPFKRIELDKGQRAGLFTQVGFLGSNDNATDLVPRPIMRGTHLSLDVLCTDLPAPPDVPPLPPNMTTKTNRELIAAFTEQPGTVCVSCHGTLINPLGFAFENYDAIGKHRTQDNGFPVDASGTYEFAEGPKSFQNAVELMNHVARGKEAHECYSRRVFEYLYGRDMVPNAAGDKNLIQEVGRRSKGSASVKAMILDLLTTDAFLARQP